MEFSSSKYDIEDLVKEIKEDIFYDENDNVYSLIATSAYDTAWLAIIPDTKSVPIRPMFKNCLDWVLNNQKEEGFWGEYDAHGLPTFECLPSTIACMVALKTWGLGDALLDKGMNFVKANAGQLLEGMDQDSCPRWFAIIFPGMMETARSIGLDIMFTDPLMKKVVTDVSKKRKLFLQREEVMDKNQFRPLLSYFEAMPFSDDVDNEYIAKHISPDGSLFQSPSATASAFMATGNKDCLAYLQSVVQACPDGVPPTYPMDEEFIKLCLLSHLQRLGLAEHFNQEIGQVLHGVYRNYMNQEARPMPSISSVASQLYKDSLAFWLLRIHGNHISPRSFCWFLDKEIQDHIEHNREEFKSAMLNVYRATHLMFPGEFELEEAKAFSKKFLLKTQDRKGPSFPNFNARIENELRFPWLARMDHLEHRTWIEDDNNAALWPGKSSFHRLSGIYNDKLVELAVRNYEYRQSIYKKELKDLTRWSKTWGLSDMGFARDKTAYCYFAVASSACLPPDSDIRTLVAKSGIIITVADDFYDIQGASHEFEILTDAIRRWDGTSLIGHSKTIFDVLDDHVTEIAGKYFQQKRIDITNYLRDLWYETFQSWFTEAKWSRSGEIPSIKEYLETGMTSIATHTIVLPASCFLDPSLPNYKLGLNQYETITQLMMVIARLLNDTQSYEKEIKDGKSNYVVLHLKENPEANIEESVAYVRDILDKKEKEFIEQALLEKEGSNALSKTFRHLHLSCLKTFQMFFNAANKYDSETEMLQDIQKAIYVPPEVGKQLEPVLIPTMPLQEARSTKRYQTMATYRIERNVAKGFCINHVANIGARTSSSVGLMKVPVTAGKLKLCFM